MFLMIEGGGIYDFSSVTAVFSSFPFQNQYVALLFMDIELTSAPPRTLCFYIPPSHSFHSTIHLLQLWAWEVSNSLSYLKHLERDQLYSGLLLRVRRLIPL